MRGRITHYVVCLMAFVVFLAGYTWHREVIFDVAHAKATPSYTGTQLFYNPYINTLDYGIKLSLGEVGPNFAQVVTDLRNRLQPNPKESKFLPEHYIGSADAQQFAEANMFGLTSDELIDQVLARPNYEYFTLLSEANDDRVLLAASLEIARTHPIMILRYSLRNFLHFIFAPGYAHTRYNFKPFSPVGLVFFPTYSLVAPEFAQLPARAAREITFDSVSLRPQMIGSVLDAIQNAWAQNRPRRSF